MKKYVLKKSILSICFVVISVALMMITFPVMKMGGVLPKYFLMELCYILAVALITFSLPLILQEISQTIVLIVEFVILIVSASLYLSRGDVFNWSLIKQMGQLKGVGDMIKIPVWSLIGGILMIAGFILACIFIKTKKVKLRQFYNYLSIFIVIISLAMCTSGNIIVHYFIRTDYEKESYFTSDFYMYSSYDSSYASLQKFGFYGYYVEDFFRRLFPSIKPEINISEVAYEKYSSVLNGLCEDNNVIMIYAESFDIYGISKELTPTLWAMKNGVDLTSSGISEFYNVTKKNGQTTISRKDFDFDGTNYTYNGTNIYKNTTAQEVGLQLSNHMSYESTDYSEMKSLTGVLWDTPYTLPKFLDDYQSTYIHGNGGWFYTRENRMESHVGFDKALFVEDMQDFIVGELTGLNCYSMDSETIRHYTDDTSENIFPTGEKFFTYFMTITTHGGYAYSSYLDNNYSFVDAVANSEICDDMFNLYNSLDDNLKTSVREYFARTLDTEYAISYIVNYLYENNLLDKTIITFTGDHYAYSNNIGSFKKEYVNKILKKDYYSYVNVVEGFIYSTQIKNSFLLENDENRVVTHITESVDLAPTILTLLGRDYEQSLFLGSAVINKSLDNPTKTVYNKVMRSYFYGLFENEYFKSYDGDTVIIKDPNNTYTQEQLDQFKKDCSNMVSKKYVVDMSRS